MSKKKKPMILCISLLLLLGISTAGAVSWSTGISLGVRDTSMYDYVISPAIDATVGDFEFGLNIAEGKWLDGGLYYNGHAGKTFRYEIGTGFHEVYDRGGMWGLTADFGQEFLFADHWILKYMIGFQLGLSWSNHAKEYIPLSESPYIELELGWKNDFFTGKVYWVGDKLYERTWQSLPIVGAYLSYDINPNNQIYMDSYFKIADYMRQPDCLISATETRIGYRYIGGR